MEGKTVNILVEKQTSRLDYTLDFVFTSRGIEYEIIELKDSVGDAIHLNYSSKSEDEIPFVECSSLLFDSALASELPQFDHASQCFLFDDKRDLFASIFFVLSRMEEYLIGDRDKHNRFSSDFSLQKKYGILDKAICDRWANEILDLLGVQIKTAITLIEPTFDIDNAFAYKYKGGLRRKLSIGRDLIQKNKTRIEERKAVDNGGKDPYDTYGIIEKIAKKVPKVRVFWLTESSAKYDRNVPLEHPEIHALLKRLRQFAQIGIHPSYDSFGNHSQVKKEILRLEHVIDSKITASRQHFLRMSLPETYEVLLKSGISDDYTMCFADHFGFRCGTARSIPWFDLKKNEISPLIVHPFVYMDGTLNEYLNLSIEESKEVISNLYREVSSYGGVFRFIWHNETIGDYGKWKGWSEVLNFTIELSNE